MPLIEPDGLIIVEEQRGVYGGLNGTYNAVFNGETIVTSKPNPLEWAAVELLKRGFEPKYILGMSRAVGEVTITGRLSVLAARALNTKREKSDA